MPERAVRLDVGAWVRAAPDQAQRELRQCVHAIHLRLKSAAWISKILGSGRVPIQVVQTKLYRADSTVDVEAMSRLYRTVVCEIGIDDMRAEWSQVTSAE